MKKYFYYMFVILASTIVLAGCGSSDDEVTPPEPGPVPVPGPLQGSATRPVEWLNWQEAVLKDYNPQSMTITCDAENIEFDVDELDLMGSFINGQCRGCAQPVKIGDKFVFFLTVQLCHSDDTKQTIPVTFRYYSHNGTKMYSYGPIDFVFDANWGKLSEPYHFDWKPE